MEDNRNSRKAGVAKGNGARKVTQGKRMQGSRPDRAMENGTKRQAASSAGRPPQGKKRSVQAGRPTQGKKRPAQAGRPVKGGKAPLTPQQMQRKKRNKILLFVAEIFVLLILLVAFWGADKVRKINIVTIEEEEEFINAYLQLQSYRFGDRISFNIDINEECKKILIPKLTLVTFVLCGYNHHEINYRIGYNRNRIPERIAHQGTELVKYLRKPACIFLLFLVCHFFHNS